MIANKILQTLSSIRKRAWFINSSNFLTLFRLNILQIDVSTAMEKHVAQ